LDRRPFPNDHDNRLAGMSVAAKRLPGIIPATELTAGVRRNRTAPAGYFVDTQNPKLLGEMARFQQVRQMHSENGRRLTPRRSPASGIRFALANCRSPGRPHVGRAWSLGGFCATSTRPLNDFSRDRPAWVPKFKISALDAIAPAPSGGRNWRSWRIPG